MRSTTTATLFAISSIVTNAAPLSERDSLPFKMIAQRNGDPAVNDKRITVKEDGTLWLESEPQEFVGVAKSNGAVHQYDSSTTTSRLSIGPNNEMVISDKEQMDNKGSGFAISDQSLSYEGTKQAVACPDSEKGRENDYQVFWAKDCEGGVNFDLQTVSVPETADHNNSFENRQVNDASTPSPCGNSCPCTEPCPPDCSCTGEEVVEDEIIVECESPQCDCGDTQVNNNFTVPIQNNNNVTVPVHNNITVPVHNNISVPIQVNVTVPPQQFNFTPPPIYNNGTPVVHTSVVTVTPSETPAPAPTENTEQPTPATGEDEPSDIPIDVQGQLQGQEQGEIQGQDQVQQEDQCNTGVNSQNQSNHDNNGNTITIDNNNKGKKSTLQLIKRSLPSYNDNSTAPNATFPIAPPQHPFQNSSVPTLNGTNSSQNHTFNDTSSSVNITSHRNGTHHNSTSSDNPSHNDSDDDGDDYTTTTELPPLKGELESEAQIEAQGQGQGQVQGEEQSQSNKGSNQQSQSNYDNNSNTISISNSNGRGKPHPRAKHGDPPSFLDRRDDTIPGEVEPLVEEDSDLGKDITSKVQNGGASYQSNNDTSQISEPHLNNGTRPQLPNIDGDLDAVIQGQGQGQLEGQGQGETQGENQSQSNRGKNEQSQGNYDNNGNNITIVNNNNNYPQQPPNNQPTYLPQPPNISISVFPPIIVTSTPAHSASTLPLPIPTKETQTVCTPKPKTTRTSTRSIRAKNTRPAANPQGTTLTRTTTFLSHAVTTLSPQTLQATIEPTMVPVPSVATPAPDDYPEEEVKPEVAAPDQDQPLYRRGHGEVESISAEGITKPHQYNPETFDVTAGLI